MHLCWGFYWALEPLDHAPVDELEHDLLLHLVESLVSLVPPPHPPLTDLWMSLIRAKSMIEDTFLQFQSY